MYPIQACILKASLQDQKGWCIMCVVQNLSEIMVRCKKREQTLPQCEVQLEFEWCLELLFDRTTVQLHHMKLAIIDICFAKEVTTAQKEQVLTLLGDLYSPAATTAVASNPTKPKSRLQFVTP
jgi:hypothetical protein